VIKTILFFLVGAMAVSIASAQQVYKWTDDKGKVHYGDIPTSNKIKKVDIKPPMKGAVKPGPLCPYAKS